MAILLSRIFHKLPISEGWRGNIPQDSPARTLISKLDVPECVYADIMPYSPTTVSIESLEVQQDKRGSGLGGRFMKNITSLADELGVTIELEIGGEDNEFDLVQWYSKYGFKHVNGFWRREPKS